MRKIKIILTALFMAFLTACASNGKSQPTQTKQVNAPEASQVEAVSQTKSVNQTETASKAKNKKASGKAETKKYKIDNTPYSQNGKASYYHNKFNGRRTASGEIYNSTKLTAAHRNLPFGTMVVVTNLKNKRQVTVKINDRGPFIKGRIIDVSRAAAEKLGLIAAGVGDVHVEKIHQK